jgi:hypothetical protein
MSSPDITVQAIIKEHPDHDKDNEASVVTTHTNIPIAKEVEEGVFFKDYVYVNELVPVPQEAPAPAVAPFNFEALKAD